MDTDTGVLIVSIYCLPLVVLHAVWWIVTRPVVTTYWMIKRPDWARSVYERRNPDNEKADARRVESPKEQHGH